MFEISSVEEFLFCFLNKLNVETAWVGAVHYAQRAFTSFDEAGSKAPDPWRKPYRRGSDGYRFDKEREFRILMSSDETISLDLMERMPEWPDFFVSSDSA